MGVTFLSILQGHDKSLVLLENESFVSLLESSPLKKGHAIVVPKLPIDAFFDLEDETLRNLIVFAKKVAGAIQQIVPCQKIGVLVYGINVRRAHLHLIPIDGTPGELDFSRAKPAPPDELVALAKMIRAVLKLDR